MTNLISILSAFIGGAFLLFGYFLQKYLENRRTLKEKKRQAYSNFFKIMFKNIDKRLKQQDDDNAEEVFWKTQVALYGSDEVITNFSNLNNLLPSKHSYVEKDDSQESIKEIKEAFDKLLLSMRKDTLRKTKISIKEISGVSPILNK